EAGVPVLAGPVLSLPTRDSDRYDKPYQNAALLHQAGVQVALRTGEVENVRNLAFNAGFAASYGREIGFGPAEALRAVTLTPAEIFGIADEVGSIEVGKRGTLFVATGDPFETATQITHVFIDGYQVPMESRQTELGSTDTPRSAFKRAAISSSVISPLASTCARTQSS
ncbi:MAG: amidohydrolase family protein, partial [Bacteroidota bacterium]